MSLRKSPRRTPAFLAALRANSQKSTGPRTPEGKSRMALNALRHGAGSRDLYAHLLRSRTGAAEYQGIFEALVAATLPGNEQQVAMLGPLAAHVWTMKRKAEEWIAWRSRRPTFAGWELEVLPRPWRMRIRLAGWRVTVSVWMRRGRVPTALRGLASGACLGQGRVQMHAGVTVTSSIGHPVLGYRSLNDVPPGKAFRVVIPAELECNTKQGSYKNVIPIHEDLPGSPVRSPGRP